MSLPTAGAWEWTIFMVLLHPGIPRDRSCHKSRPRPRGPDPRRTETGASQTEVGAARRTANPQRTRTDLIAALLLAHLTVPAQLLQPLGLDAVCDRLRAEEIRLPHGAGPVPIPILTPIPPLPEVAAAPRKRIPAGSRMRGAGALTFSGAVVEAPPCSPGGPRSRWSSRNGTGTGWDGRCGDGGARPDGRGGSAG